MWPARKLVMLLGWLVMLSVPVWAQEPLAGERDAVVERRWLDDPGSHLTPQAALQRAWTPFTGPLSRGFTTSSTWVRLKIDPAAAGPGTLASDRRLVLLIMPGHLDEVTVYRVDRLSEAPAVVGDKQVTGEQRPGPHQGLMHHAVLFDDGAAPFELLLRLRTQSNHTLHVQALRWDDARDVAARQQTLVFAFLIFTVMVIGWAALAWVGQRAAVLSLFMAHQASALLVAVTLMGVLRMYGPPALAPALNTLTSQAIPFTTLLTVLFHARLLADLGARKIDVKLLQGTAVMPLVALPLVGFGWVTWGLLLAHLGIIVLMLLVIVTAWRTRPSHPALGEHRGTWRSAYLVVVYLMVASITMPQSLRVLGVLSLGTWTFGGFFAYGFAGSVLMGSLLLLRGNEARRRRRSEELVFAQARREAETQRARAVEQAELMTMLTHELKTPLSVVSLALGIAGQQPTIRERALRAVVNMREVIDRCAQAARVDDDSAQHESAPALTPVPLEEVLAEVLGAQLQAARVDVQTGHSLRDVLSDRQMLVVIVGNLVENALKYSPDESVVQASLETATFKGRAGVRLRVTNRVGVAGRPDPALVFDKYHRGPYARHRSGSGLGLYLSRRLAYRLGAELSLCPSEGQEVSFELWVPS